MMMEAHAFPPVAFADLRSLPVAKMHSGIEKEERLRALWEEFLPEAMHLLLVYIGRETCGGEEPRDVLQDTCLLGWRKIRQFRRGLSAEEFALLLQALAKRCIQNGHRRARMQKRSGGAMLRVEGLVGSSREPAAKKESSEQLLEREEDAGALRLALTHLDPRDEELVRRNMLEGTSLGVLAAERGVSTDAIRMRISRSFSALRKILLMSQGLS